MNHAVEDLEREIAATMELIDLAVSEKASSGCAALNAALAQLQERLRAAKEGPPGNPPARKVRVESSPDDEQAEERAALAFELDAIVQWAGAEQARGDEAVQRMAAKAAALLRHLESGDLQRVRAMAQEYGLLSDGAPIAPPPAMPSDDELLSDAKRRWKQDQLAAERLAAFVAGGQVHGIHTRSGRSAGGWGVETLRDDVRRLG